MAEAGILTEDDRVELIEGEIIKMTPIGIRHSSCVVRLIALLSNLIGQTALLNVQNPIRLNDFSEPQPDVSLLKRRDDFYSSNHPTPTDVLLIIEVSDNTIEYDRNIKIPLYAAVSIPEVWLVNLIKDILEVYREPQGGMYKEVRYFTRGETVSPLFDPKLTLTVDSIIG